jgi:hypothetical protein
MTHDRGSGATGPAGELSRSRHRVSSTHFGRWAVAAVALLGTLAVFSMDIGDASSSPLVKVSIITGSVSECGAGPFLGLRRTFTVTLHVRPSGRVVATTTLNPSTLLSHYAFAVGVGIYYLTTSETTSPPPRSNIVVRANSKDIIEATIATVCQ